MTKTSSATSPTTSRRWKRPRAARPAAAASRSLRFVRTIAAIATGPAAGGVGIIRLSGPAALETARRVAALPHILEPRHAYFTRVAALDDGLALFFPAPHSYTGED